MNVHAPKEQLLAAVALAERLTGKKESLPVLSCVIIEAQDKKLVLRATNLEAGIEVSVPSSVEGTGKLAVPASILRETIRAVPGERVDLRETDGNLSVEARG